MTTPDTTRAPSQRAPSQDADTLKRRAAAEALTRVESGMKLGLGTGSTMAHFLDLLGEELSAGRLTGIVGVATSERTARHAAELEIPVRDLSDVEIGRAHV